MNENKGYSMDPLTAGLLVGGSLLGTAGSLWNGSLNRDAQNKANQQNYQAQKEFYQNSVLWRTQDAARAGINKLYALGADSANFSPSFSAATNTGIGDALNHLGGMALQAAQINSMSAQQKLFEAQADYYSVMAQKDAATPIKLDTAGVPTTSAGGGKEGFDKLTIQNLSSLPMDKWTKLNNSPYVIQPMSKDGKSFVMSIANDDLRQSWADSRAEQTSSIFSVLAEMGYNTAGANFYKDKIILADGSIFKISEFSSRGFPALHFTYKGNQKELKAKHFKEITSPDYRPGGLPGQWSRD